MSISTLVRAIVRQDYPAANDAFAAVMKQKTEQALARAYQDVAKTFVTSPKK